ncbi:SusD-like starch-binding protein associating with outer membrane [Pontibacter ummariensis]|uniref:Starch-binding associating with outer membrane n=1 Tax=Pontibacter ummariensis TaxID=1610492 RepID=A0A239B8T6_9BACT|nr:SusD/RagB family nutrient-binding outer membrane lipoprotein [Pontibacter ummariensis]PRY16368.1 SusD-like starch-binding protein associating with outer membrane [Pontibacter ummariensis]SNS03951.1 Starch-binding associating with outer membrane [Pontibacter ummariensis]
MIKNIYKSTVLVALLFSAWGCDDNFEEINTNPIQPTTLNPEYLFSDAQRTSAVNTLTYQAPIVQQVQIPYSGNPAGGNLNVVNETNTAPIFNTLYTESIRNLTDVINKTQDNPERSNLYNMARIWRAYCFQVLVDTYGDVPYSEAGKGFLESSYLPAYEESSAIYEDILKEYQQATDALDPSKDVVLGDLFYQGNIDKWKKLGNSLLLRAGMRYTETNEGKAQSIVAIAVDPARGGVMTSTEDDAFVPFSSIFTHPMSSQLLATERHNYYVGAPFVEFLQTKEDPRLRYIAVKYENPVNPLETAGAENTNPAEQQGMPYGFDETNIATAPGFPGKIGSAFAYSQLNRRTVLRLDRPEFLVTYAQTSLLLAEAAHRGYLPGGEAAAQDYYETGVKAHMKQMEAYSGETESSTINISSEQVSAYLAQPGVAYDPAHALEQINEQYWVASFLQFQEGWSNFRRSGFPGLKPINYTGQDPSVNATGGGFIRRLTYPLRERSVNTANVEAAIARMGGNTLGTRIFWDAQ